MKLTDRNYFSRRATREYMSASQFKDFAQCEAGALARIRGKYPEKQSAALLLGSYIDAYFGGTIDAFRGEHPEIFKKTGDLKAEFAAANVAISRIESQKTMMHYLSGEKQRIMTGEIAGVPFKIKIDSYLPGKAIVDLKYMRDFESVYLDDMGRVPWWQAWGYDIQGAIYREIVRQNTGKTLPFILDAATKEEEPDLTLKELDRKTLDAALRLVVADAPRYDAIKRGIIKPTRCEKCRYCRMTKKVKLTNTEDDYDV